MVSKKAQKFISRKIRKNIEEGNPPKQAVAISYSQARAKGYKVGKKGSVRWRRSQSSSGHYYKLDDKTFVTKKKKMRSVS